jgi:hypothetical protein
MGTNKEPKLFIPNFFRVFHYSSIPFSIRYNRAASWVKTSFSGINPSG